MRDRIKDNFVYLYFKKIKKDVVVIIDLNNSNSCGCGNDYEILKVYFRFGNMEGF